MLPDQHIGQGSSIPERFTNLLKRRKTFVPRHAGRNRFLVDLAFLIRPARIKQRLASLDNGRDVSHLAYGQHDRHRIEAVLHRRQCGWVEEVPGGRRE